MNNLDWRLEAEKYLSEIYPNISSADNQALIDMHMSDTQRTIENVCEGFLLDSQPDFEPPEKFPDLIKFFAKKYPDVCNDETAKQIIYYNYIRNQIQHEGKHASHNELKLFSESVSYVISQILGDKRFSSIGANWECPNCNTINKRSNRYCLSCAFDHQTYISELIEKERESMEEERRKSAGIELCPICNKRENPIETTFCTGCGKNIQEFKNQILTNLENEEYAKKIEPAKRLIRRSLWLGIISWVFSGTACLGSPFSVFILPIMFCLPVGIVSIFGINFALRAPKIAFEAVDDIKDIKAHANRALLLNVSSLIIIIITMIIGILLLGLAGFVNLFSQ